MTEILTWALKYQKFGFSVIPIGPDKKPLIEWKKYQTERASVQQIEEWFRGETPPNIGIVTGKISGITVVDVEAGGKWEHYPVTMTSKTGNGGVHLFYKYAEGVSNSARIFDLTDIRGEGGYVVVPPSKTAYKSKLGLSGGVYEWVRKEKVQPFPYQMFNATPGTQKTEWQDVLKGVSSGERNQSAAQVIGKFIRTIPMDEWMTTAWQMFVLWNQGNTPPLSERELRGVFNSITGREARVRSIVEQNREEQEELDSDIKLISEIAKDITDDMTVSYPTGFKIIDENFMGGLKDGDLFFITGPTGMGKTLLAQSMTYNLDRSGQPTLWFSFEVPVGELWRKFKDMGVSDNFAAYSPEKIVSYNIEWLRKKITEARDRFKTKVVFIDHLGFIAHEPKNYDANLSSNYATVLGMICRQLKSLALQEKVAIVLLGHVRKPASGKDIEPTINDIKDSSGVAQEADAVIILHRTRKGKSEMNTDDLYEANTTVKIEKNRRTGRNKIFKVSMSEGRLMDAEEELTNFTKNVTQGSWREQPSQPFKE